MSICRHTLHARNPTKWALVNRLNSNQNYRTLTENTHLPRAWHGIARHGLAWHEGRTEETPYATSSYKKMRKCQEKRAQADARLCTNNKIKTNRPFDTVEPYSRSPLHTRHEPCVHTTDLRRTLLCPGGGDTFIQSHSPTADATSLHALAQDWLWSQQGVTRLTYPILITIFERA